MPTFELRWWPRPAPMSRSRAAALRPAPRSTMLKQPDRWTSTRSNFSGGARLFWVQPDGSSPLAIDTVPSLRKQRGTSLAACCCSRCPSEAFACLGGLAAAGDEAATAIRTAADIINDLAIRIPPTRFVTITLRDGDVNRKPGRAISQIRSPALDRLRDPPF